MYVKPAYVLMATVVSVHGQMGPLTMVGAWPCHKISFSFLIDHDRLSQNLGLAT